MKKFINRFSEMALTNSTTTNAGPRLQGRARWPGLSTACLVMAMGLTLTGCGKGSKVEELKPEDVKPVDVTAAAETQQEQRMKMAVAIRDNVMPPEPTLKLKGGEVATPEVLQAYNQLLLRAMVQRREPPESLQELQRWPLPKLPTPPPGKRVVYDVANCIVRLDPP
jgi:hypothetical protein